MRLVHETKKRPEVERAASKDAARPRLARPQLDAERSVLEATNSYMLVSVPVELDEGDTSGPIEPEALKAQRKASKYDPASLACDGSVRLETVDGTQEWPRPDLGQWPNVPQLVPTAFSAFSIGLNPTFLLELAKALGDPENVRIEFAMSREDVDDGNDWIRPSDLRPMRVTVPRGGESFGILMPIRKS